MQELIPHEYANLFPMIEAQELEQLAQDIKAHGLLEKIMLYEGKILDGRNRYAACKIAHIEPDFQEFNNGDPLAFVISKNLKRRHLTKSQLGMLATELEEIEAERAKARQRKAGEEYGRGKGKVVPILAQPIDDTDKPATKARDIAAKVVGVSHNYVSEAKKIKKTNPKSTFPREFFIARSNHVHLEK